jgi:hypothetical protein
MIKIIADLLCDKNETYKDHLAIVKYHTKYITTTFSEKDWVIMMPYDKKTNEMYYNVMTLPDIKTTLYNNQFNISVLNESDGDSDGDDDINSCIDSFNYLYNNYTEF